MSWQPLNTAPKDGTEFLVRYPLQGNVKKLVNWNTIHGYWQSKGVSDIGLAHQQVEWHPLPPNDASSSRKAFERWADSYAAIDEKFQNLVAQIAWDAWQAALAAGVKEVPHG